MKRGLNRQLSRLLLAFFLVAFAVIPIQSSADETKSSQSVNFIDLACFDRSIILNSISQKNIDDFVATCGSEIKKTIASKGITIDNDQLELISANIVAHNTAPYGNSSALNYEDLIKQKTLNCGNYTLLLGYLVQPKIAELLSIVGFHGGVIGNHGQAYFDSGSKSMMLDPTTSSVAFVDYDSLFYEENSSREVFVFNRQKDDKLNSFYANVDRALSQSLYLPSDILYYYYFNFDHMLGNLKYNLITPGGFKLYKSTNNDS
jgi:hypothetical protein